MSMWYIGTTSLWETVQPSEVKPLLLKKKKNLIGFKQYKNVTIPYWSVFSQSHG